MLVSIFCLKPPSDSPLQIKCKPLYRTCKAFNDVAPSLTFQLHPGPAQPSPTHPTSVPVTAFWTAVCSPQSACVCVSSLSKVSVSCLRCAWAMPAYPARSSQVMSPLKYSRAPPLCAAVGNSSLLFLQWCSPIFIALPGARRGARLGLPASEQHLQDWKAFFF